MKLHSKTVFPFYPVPPHVLANVRPTALQLPCHTRAELCWPTLSGRTNPTVSLFSLLGGSSVRLTVKWVHLLANPEKMGEVHALVRYFY